VILLAENNAILCKVIVKILESFQFRIRHAAQGCDALDALLAEDFALAVVDVDLPLMNGLEVAKHYRFAAIGRKRIPILGLVGGKMSERIAACVDAGMDACVPKPIDPGHLLEAVRSFVSIGTKADAAPADGGTDETVPVFAPDGDETAQLHEDPALNIQVLKDLEQLGGRGFVEDVVSQFVADANRVFPELEAAIRQADVHASRDLLHALRSCAANVGAIAIYKLCLAWREIDLEELAEHGETCLSRLQVAFEEARMVMQDYDPSKRAA
jgi:two-component system sensor histidine kinase RpfC